jgi:hypothetical protein
MIDALQLLAFKGALPPVTERSSMNAEPGSWVLNRDRSVQVGTGEVRETRRRLPSPTDVRTARAINRAANWAAAVVIFVLAPIAGVVMWS